MQKNKEKEKTKVRPVISLSFSLAVFSHSKQEAENYTEPELGFARAGHWRKKKKGVTGLHKAIKGA